MISFFSLKWLRRMRSRILRLLRINQHFAPEDIPKYLENKDIQAAIHEARWLREHYRVEVRSLTGDEEARQPEPADPANFDENLYQR